MRARPPPTLLASGCASTPCGLLFQLGGGAALNETVRRVMLRWGGHRSLEILTEWESKLLIKRVERKRHMPDSNERRLRSSLSQTGSIPSFHLPLAVHPAGPSAYLAIDPLD